MSVEHRFATPSVVVTSISARRLALLATTAWCVVIISTIATPAPYPQQRPQYAAYRHADQQQRRSHGKLTTIALQDAHRSDDDGRREAGIMLAVLQQGRGKWRYRP